MERDPIEHFAYEVLRAANLDGMPEDAKSEFVAKIRDQALRRIGIIAMEHLDGDALATFSGMLEADTPPDPSAVQEFLLERVPGFEQKMEVCLTQFADEFVTAAAA